MRRWFQCTAIVATLACLFFFASPPLPCSFAADTEEPCSVAVDKGVAAPVKAIAAEYTRRTGCEVRVATMEAAEIEQQASAGQLKVDVVVTLDKSREAAAAVGKLPKARKVAWTDTGGIPVWAAPVSDHPHAEPLSDFLGGPSGHRLWAASPLGFTITHGKTRAEAYDWVVRNRTGFTYPMTAARMVRECGGMTEGVCIDIGCGAGHLELELAKRTKWTITGLDIDPDVGPMFAARMKEAGLADRVKFVCADAQKLPFPDDSADVIVSRGTLTFIPDIGKCLREVDRVLKPTGVAFLGGRYLYTSQAHKVSDDRFREIVQQSGVDGAEVVLDRGQWVKIFGPQAPAAARNVGPSPHAVADRMVADYAIVEGDALAVCRSDGGLEQALQQGLLDMTDLSIVALYPKQEIADQAAKRIKQAGNDSRISCRVGDVSQLPLDNASFDLIAGVGPILLWGEREKAMREVYRVLRPGGVALIGGRFLHMPDFRKVSSDVLRTSLANAGIRSGRVLDDMGQWVEIRKGIKDRGSRD